jgi:hypothetical protein
VNSILAKAPYNRINNNLEENLLQMYSLIRDDEVDHLQNYIQQKNIEGVAQYNFEGIDYDEEVL